MNVEEFTALGLAEDVAKKAAEASKKELEGFIPKVRFDEVNAAKKQLEADIVDRDGQLETLKGANGDSEALKLQIDQLQLDNKKKDDDYQAQLKELALTNAIKLAIAEKAQDSDLVATLFDKEKLILSDDGKVTGLDEQLKKLETDKSFLFKPKQGEGTPPPTGFKVGSDGAGTPPSAEPKSIRDALEAHYKQA